MERLTLQIHHNGTWHRAATVAFENPDGGIASPANVDYELDYVTTWDSDGLRTEQPAYDVRALSLNYPTDFATRYSSGWPPFLLDLLPQGVGRQRIATRLGFDRPDDRAFDLLLLRHSGGSPIGNLRVEEAWRDEQLRLKGQTFQGLREEEIHARGDRFADVVDRYGGLASGSSGVQGDWPKLLLTQATNGQWYPDPLVRDEDARAHVIVKLLRSHEPDYAAILAAEAPYLEVARAFGLRVGAGLTPAPGILIIPRFDRKVTAQGMVRHGQESLVSALGIAQFGYVGHHEDYLAILKRVASDPRAEVSEYVLRDLLNFAMGNPDNHGRNTAIQKRADGWIGLTPLFDFAPMRLDPAMIVPSTRWRCLRGGDADPDWRLLCDAAAEGVMAPAELRAVLVAKANFLRALPETARKLGVAADTVARACTRHEDAARGVERLL